MIQKKKLLTVICLIACFGPVYAQPGNAEEGHNNLKTDVLDYSRYMVNDNEGNVWIGFHERRQGLIDVPRLAKWDGSELTILKGERYDITNGAVRNILPVDEGGIWLATDKGLKLIRKGEVKKQSALPQLSDGYRKITKRHIKPMVRDKDGYIWLFTRKYPEKGNYSERISPYPSSTQLWKFKDGSWDKVKNFEPSNYLGVSVTKGPKGEIIMAGKQKWQSNKNVLYRVSGDNAFFEEPIIANDFTNGEIDVIPASVHALDGRVILSYKPKNGSNKVYQGFSIYNFREENWTHFGGRKFSNFDNYYPITSSGLNRSNGKLYPVLNWVKCYKNADYGGVWMGMRYEYGENPQPGGGLVYFDGNSGFERFSPRTTKGVKPFKFQAGLAHPGDAYKNSLGAWNRVNGIADAPNGGMLVSTLSEGIWKIPAENLPYEKLRKKASLKGNLDKGAFSLYPNPLNKNSTLKVEWNNASSSIQDVVILNNEGKKIRSLDKSEFDQNGTASYQLEDLAPGTYYLSIYNEKNQFTRKFVIN